MDERRVDPPRHCWIKDPDVHRARWPGLLTGWRRDGGGWQGRVIVATKATDWRPVERWIPADRLSEHVPD